MPRKVDEYYGLDNRDLKLINVAPWEFPAPLRNPKVQEIMNKVAPMEPGEVSKVYEGTRYEAKLLQSAIWRLIQQHELDLKVKLDGSKIYLTRLEEV